MKIFRNLLIVVMLVAISGCTMTNKYGPYYGKVVDAETKEPLEGAAVLIVFYTVSATVGGEVYKYADAVETLTDRKGEFNISARRLVSPRVLRRWDDYGYVTIFKPGYGCYPNHEKVKPMFLPNGSIPEKYHIIFELPRLTSIKERRDASLPTASGTIPFEKQSKLIELINREREFLGYPGKIEKKAWELNSK